jgi:hypothetical protein
LTIPYDIFNYFLRFRKFLTIFSFHGRIHLRKGKILKAPTAPKTLRTNQKNKAGKNFPRFRLGTVTKTMVVAKIVAI